MFNKRVKISSVVESQLPGYVRDTYPLASEFLRSYYRSQDSQGLPADIINNIDQYLRLENNTNIVSETSLRGDIGFFDQTIPVESTKGFPDQYGIIQIDSEIITYTGITTNTFTGCIRGFSGISSYKSSNRPDELVFSSTEREEHTDATSIKNLSILFLKEFLKKLKRQIAPGFDNRNLAEDLNERLFLSRSIDFYSSKGTSQSYEILFRALYGENVDLNTPSDYLLIPSDAGYRVTNDLVVEAVEGDPELLVNRTLFQDKNQYHNKASGTITNVEKIFRGDNEYYIISLDADFEKDIDANSGSIRGEFAICPKTSLLNNVTIGSTVLDVDSTVGFAEAGELSAILPNETISVLSYTSKSSNQFYGVSGVTQSLGETQQVRQNTVAFGYTSRSLENPVQVRIGAVLSDLNIPDNTFLFEEKDKIEVKSLGKISEDIRTNDWFYNIKVEYEISKVTQRSDTVYDLETKDSNILNKGDFISVSDTLGVSKTVIIDSINSDKEFTVKDITLNPERVSSIKKLSLKGESRSYPYIKNYLTNIQNTYLDSEDIYITSNSIPSYSSSIEPENFSVSFSGSFFGEELVIGLHPFYTGDAIQYVGTGLNISSATYFVKVINSTTIKLSASKPNIENNKFFDVSGTTIDSKITKFGYKGKTLEPQKLIRKLANPEQRDKEYKTNKGTIGIFVNGVELQNYKSTDIVYNGKLENIIVSAEGKNYDIINPPILSIDDRTGSGASGRVSVKGDLKRIEIIDPGVDYLEEPSITISGGNGLGAIAETSLINYTYSVNFNANKGSNQVDLVFDTIAFNTIHKLRDGERVFYTSSEGTPIGGLDDKSEYYVGVVDAFRVKMYKTHDDAIKGLNQIDLTSDGSGTHEVSTVKPRKKISNIRVVDSGKNYENKYRQCTSSGIDTAKNSIRINNHDYSSGEIVTYDASNIAISGLSTLTSYYVTKIDDNEFYLSQVGIGTTNKDQYYKSREFVDLRSTGSGIHSFNYETISVKIDGKIGLSTITTTNSVIVDPSKIRSGVSTFIAGVGQSSFAFNYTPIRNRNQLIDVFVNGVRLSDSDFDSSSGTDIILNYASSGGEIIEMVSYGSTVRTNVTSVSCGAGQTNFPFLYSPGFLDVYYNGLKLPQRDYVSDNSQSVTLKEGAIEGDVVELITYPEIIKKDKTFTATEGQTIFKFEHQTEYGLIDVYLNGVKLPTEDYDASNRFNIILNDPVSHEDVVYVSYIFLSKIVGLGDDFGAKIQPIFRGNINTAFVTNNGADYGTKEILNYNRQPLFTLNSGRNAELIPVINQTTGGIEDVLVRNPGSGYNSPPDLKLIGTGSRAILTPIVKNGRLDRVIVVNPGVKYDPENTSILVESAGLGAKFESEIQSWNIDNFYRVFNKNKISLDDGFLYEGSNSTLKYNHLYTPRKLREITYGKRNFLGKTLLEQDLVLDINSREIDSDRYHSPIVGWAYDGNPIYGPYGFETPSGGTVKRMKSGYVLSTISDNRPSLSLFPQGSFINDWIYDGSGDLDEHNGRFCVTPEYPDGVYAYFTTVSDDVDTVGPFRNYKRPSFPYVIGDSFKSKPIEFNFNIKSNQDEIDINSTNWFRNTKPYGLILDNTSYQFFFDPNVIRKQTAVIEYAQPGSLTGVNILDGGDNYKVDDNIILESVTGRGASAKVDKIKGKEVNTVSVATSYVEDVEFLSLGNDGRYIGISPSPHNFENAQLISIAGLSTYKNDLQNNFRIIVKDSRLSLAKSISSISVTGIVTHLNLVNVPEYPEILEDDILSVGSEDVKVLNLDSNKSRIRILRAQNSTVGSSHSSSTVVKQKSRRVEFKTSYQKSGSTKINRKLYFNPRETVAIAATWGVGITSTLFLGTEELEIPASVSTGQSTILLLNNLRDITNFSGGGYVSLVNPTDSNFARKNIEVLSIGTSSLTLDFDSSQLIGTGVTVYVNKVDSVEIPTRSVYIKNHGLQTGEKVVYNSNNGNVLSVIRDTTPITLTQNYELFVRKINNNVFSLTTSTVDLGTDVNDLQFTDIGTGEYHSFKTVRQNVITGQLERNIATVSTGSSHGLSLKDMTYIDINVGISTVVKVFYNDRNRRLVVNKRTFAISDVDTIKDTIRLNNHGLYNGQKIILQTSSSPDFVNDEIYYVIVFDSNKIRLSKTYFESRLDLPSFVNIKQPFTGSIFQINPQIKYRSNQKVIFDLSDSSLSYNSSLSERFSAFEFNLYTDERFQNLYTTSKDLNEFNVTKNGKIGVDSDASLTFIPTNKTPEVIYYTLKPVPGVPVSTKNEIIYDFEKITSAHSIINVKSEYSGTYSVVSASSTTFSYVLPSQPETDGYSNITAKISYETNSKNISGSISSIRVTSNGSGYSSIPDISEIETDEGDFSILNPYSNNIGKIKTIKINDIGFDYPSDNTLRPSVNLANLLQVDRYSSINSIGISSAGNGYTTPANLIVIDTVSNKILDVILKYEIGDTQVQIIKNTKDLYDSSPKVIPTNNSNSIGISTVSYDNTTKNVVVTLNRSYSIFDSFPFSIGDSIMIEGIGVSDNGKGYNTKNYGYEYFEVTSINPRFGGINPTVTFNLSNFLSSSETPGQFDSDNSVGKIVATKNFPLFKIELEKNDFLVGETIFTEDGIEGIVDKWNQINDRLKILSPFGIFNKNSVIEGKTSGTKALITDSNKFEGSYNINSSSRVKKGWKRETGFLNNSFQRVQDSDYYQYFSYELKSTISFDKWDEPVQSLNHTAGFKKFGNLLIEDNPTIGILTSQDRGDFSATVDIINVTDVDCFTDWDLASENYKYIDTDLFSDEIIFGSKIIQNYFESVTNRVLSIDDISSQFNSDERIDQFSIVDRYPLDERYKKYLTFVRDRRFTNERQLLVVTVVHDDLRGYLNQYGRVETSTDLGSFDFSIRLDQGNLDFYPVKFRKNNYDISLASYNLEDTFVGVGSTSLGSISKVETQGSIIPVGSVNTTVPIASIEKDYRAAKVLVSVATTDSRYQYEEISILRNSSDEIHTLEYGQLVAQSRSQNSVSGLGTYDAKVPYKLIPTVSEDRYFSSSGIKTSTGGTGFGPFGGFQIGDHTEFTGTGLRQFTLQPEDARNYEFLTVSAIVGNDNNGGEQPEEGESVNAYYSIDGGLTYVDFGEIIPYNGSSSLKDYTIEIPVAAKTANTLFRLSQRDNSSNIFDTIGVKSIIFKGDRTYLNFYPNAGIAGTVNTMTVGLALTAGTGIGSMTFNTNTVESIYTQISATSSPTPNRIAGWSTDVFNCGYLIVGVEDVTNNEYEMFELLAAQDDNDQSITEFGNLLSSSGIGTIGIQCTGENLDITYTPNPLTDVNVRVWQHSLRLVDNFNGDTGIDFNNGSINSGDGVYTGTELDIRRNFNIQHSGKDVFEKYFSPTTDPRTGIVSSNEVVNLITNTITLDEHFFVSGEELQYSYPDIPGFAPIGIATTTISGVSTNILPSKLYAVRTGKNGIKVSASASEALSVPPSVLDLTDVGIGVSHKFTAIKQNQKVLVTIDNLIQSPIVSTAVTTIVTKLVTTHDESIILEDVTHLKNGDIIKINQEILRIDSINSIKNQVFVRRSWMGTDIGSHLLNSEVLLLRGNYNIVGNTINFSDPPLGLSPIGSTTNPPDAKDFTGISTSSVFSGRVFTKTGDTNGTLDTYDKNYLFDDFSDSFTGIRTEYTLTNKTSDRVSGISTDNAIIVLNGIFQSPSRFGPNPIVNAYKIVEDNGSSTISFTEAPRGGQIVSVASTNSLGYQTLVSAGGSAIVSGLGTIQSIVINNMGSGYRPGIQTNVSVSVATSSLNSVNVEKIGVASISNGHIVSVDIVNPGSGYTSTNPPVVIIDDPLPYFDLELNYKNGTSGIGTGAKVSLVVGQGSSITNFDVTHFGSGYELGDTLTVSVGGSMGLPLDTSYPFKRFELTVDGQYQDQFDGWSIGNLTLFDKVDRLFNGFDRSFPLMINGERRSIKSREGSEIDNEMTLLVFLNGILQEPGVAYKFDDGSTLTFTEPPVNGEELTILFYQGNEGVDVIFKDILETVKVGDTLQLKSDTIIDQDKRTVFSIESTDVVTTNIYGGQGIVTTGLYRPVEWCKQKSDKFINGSFVSKDREEYDYLIYPSTNIIKNIESSDSVIFVENTSTIFDSINENPTPASTRTNITIIDQDTTVSAAATATIDHTGSVTSFTVTNPGVGYTEAPVVALESPIGLGTEARATAIANVSEGKVTSISINFGGTGYTKAPVVLIEPPNPKYEIIEKVAYAGDFGIISGISTTSIGIASTGIVFDLYIPELSSLRDPRIVSTAATISKIKPGYYFVVSESNIGSGVTSLNSNGSVISAGTEYLDNVYEAIYVSTTQSSVPGVGVTDVVRVTVSISDYNNLDLSSTDRIIGKYSWGRIEASRNSSNFYEIYNNGLSGINTSPIVRRVNPLENSNYLQ